MCNSHCIHCGSEITYSKYSKKEKRFCSGGCAGRYNHIQAVKRREEEYYKKPNTCGNCGVELSYKEKGKSFCSSSCSASFNNKGRHVSEQTKAKLSAIIKQKIAEGSFSPKYPSKLGMTWVKAKQIDNDWKLYRRRCYFRFDENTLRQIGGYDLYIERGFYHYSKNPNGVEKDHLFSVYDGWGRKVPPEIMNHPANCQIIDKKANSIKGKSSSITLEELYDRIEKWPSRQDSNLHSA